MVKEISPQEVSEKLNEFRIIDVREHEEYVGPLRHMTGSELVPLSEVATTAQTWMREVKYLMVCRSGARSAAAGSTLVGKGFDEVYNLTGGMIAWNEAGFHVCEDSHAPCSHPPKYEPQE